MPSTVANREIWLLVAQGGWWTPKEIKTHLDPEIDIQAIYNRLWVMSNRQRCLVTRGRGEKRQYAVTPSCITPYGLTVSQIISAVAGEALAVEAR